ncbi:MAG: dehydrogenase [Ilumatobacteraceae bacterium]|nr:dehydrogenase [Ilumatobacteraceae bacterium]
MGVRMSGICEDRVVVITGAGRGIGRGHALEFARQGAKVVVNDIGAELDGTGGSASPAQQVVEEIRDLGGEAVVNGDDVSSWDGARNLIDTAIRTYGDLHVVVNNAGVVRDRMFANASEEEWDLTMQVHLKGHFTTARHAAAYWRDRAKAGEAVDARIINTTSGAGLMGSVGQAAYSAAKGGIISLTLVQAAELGRYGITANAIAPAARTRMTEQVFAGDMAKPEDPNAFDAMAADNVAPLVAWLGSPDSAGVTGRVFEVEAGKVSVADGWRHGTVIDNGARWEPIAVGEAVTELLAAAPAPTPVYGAS